VFIVGSSMVRSYRLLSNWLHKHSSYLMDKVADLLVVCVSAGVVETGPIDSDAK
jgi:hypothetical protein